MSAIQDYYSPLPLFFSFCNSNRNNIHSNIICAIQASSLHNFNHKHHAVSTSCRLDITKGKKVHEMVKLIPYTKDLTNHGKRKNQYLEE